MTTKTMSMILVSVLCAAAAAACGGKSGGSTAATTPAGGGGDGGDALAAQIERGKTLYTDKCAGCHGAGGEGSDKGPPVVGPEAFPLDPRPGSERTTQFKTAADVFAFASANMPPKDPGGLTTDEYLAIFAFDLTANGVTLAKPLDADAAAAIVLHP